MIVECRGGERRGEEGRGGERRGEEGREGENIWLDAMKYRRILTIPVRHDRELRTFPSRPT